VAYVIAKDAMANLIVGMLEDFHRNAPVPSVPDGQPTKKASLDVMRLFRRIITAILSSRMSWCVTVAIGISIKLVTIFYSAISPAYPSVMRVSLKGQRRSEDYLVAYCAIPR
jgi:hypothetical protein